MQNPSVILRQHGVSDRIARNPPLERSPVVEAQFSHSGFIFDTWGGYASRLVEYWGEHGVDLTLDDACDALVIDKGMVRNDSSVQFRENNDTDRSYDTYKNKIKDQIIQKATEYFCPFVDDLEQRVDNILDAFQTDNPDEVKSRADTTDGEIEAITSSEEYNATISRRAMIRGTYDDLYHNSIMAPTEDERQNAKEGLGKLKEETDAIDDVYTKLKTRINLLRTKRDAEKTGLAITLDQFITVLYETDVSDSPLSKEWGMALADTVNDILGELSSLDQDTIKVTDVYVGKDAFDKFKSNISAWDQILTRVKKHMSFIKPAFWSKITVANHPLVNGVGEK